MGCYSWVKAWGSTTSPDVYTHTGVRGEIRRGGGGGCGERSAPVGWGGRRNNMWGVGEKGERPGVWERSLLHGS